MEDDLHFIENGRRPQFFGNGRLPQLYYNGRQPQHSCKWKTTKFVVQMEDDLNILNL